ncbi:hypothetical protein CU666_19820 [Pseudomonas syringae pv. actinidifoliorum]|nr:hypothetical protein [Pseudomonas syringae pv. actinidifoliorum]NAT60179.1 hypothetical protein [Pseudomonas syringae pv. actinidifoliorum]
MERFSEKVTRHTEFSHQDYWKAIEWLRDQGLNVNNSRYVAVMRDLGEFGIGQYSAELIWGLSEVDTLYRVYLDVLKEKELGKKNVRKLLNGAKFLRDEKIGGSENSRNYLFELTLAGVFSKSGAEIDFDTVADFKFSLPMKSIGYVECKRVSSNNKLEDNIAEAYDQVQLRCIEKDVGVVGVDLSRLMWKHFNEQLIHSSLQDIGPYLKTAFEEITKELNGKYRFNNTVMIIGYYCIPFVNVADESIQFFRGMEIDLKYYEKHIGPPFNHTFRHRAGLALWMKDHLKLSLS